MKKFSILFFLIFNLALFNYLWAQDQNILAKVGPYKLYMSDLEDLIKQNPQVSKALKQKPELKQKLIKALVERWLQISLLALAAKDEHLDKNPDVQKKLIELEKNFLAQKYLEKELKEIKITDKNLREYYKKNKNRYVEPEGLKIKHILIYVPKNADKATQEKAYKKALKIRDQLLKGVKFETLAKIYSDDTASKDKGGDLGIIRKGETIPEFEKEIFKLKPGKISQPIKSIYGYHIVKVEKKIPAKTLSFEEVKNIVKQDYIQEQENKIIKKLFVKLVQKYNPKIYLKKDVKNGEK